jgi:hypothetical protein
LARFFAGAAACFLLLTGAFLFWQSRAAEAPQLPPAPPARMASSGVLTPNLPAPPEASAKSREEKRFSRAEKDKNGNGALSFDEWAVKRIDKFAGTDKGRSGGLDAAEYATTAPPPPKKKRCSC